MVCINILKKIFDIFCCFNKYIRYLLSFFLLLLIVFYRYFISPFLSPRCRYNPTCSTYGIIAIKRFGPFVGGYLTVKRIIRCHPWGGYGYDPVPAFKAKIKKRK